MRTSTIVDRKNYLTARYYSRYVFLKDFYKSGNILDLGNLGGVYGEGKSSSSHKKFCSEVVHSVVYGFDLFAPKKVREYPNQKQGNIEDGLPYDDGFFDTVYMGELIEHLSDFKTVLGEIHRILKKDGKLILDTPNPYSFLRILKWVIKREESLGDPTHLVFFTPASLVATLRKHGFAVEALSEKFHRRFIFSPHWLVKGLGGRLLISVKKVSVDGK